MVSENNNIKEKVEIAPPGGGLAVFSVGLGAVTTTFIAGVLNVRRGLNAPIGSLTQTGRIRLGKRTDHRNPLIKDFVPLVDLKELHLFAWDIFKDNAYDAAVHAGVLQSKELDPVRDELSEIVPMPAVFNRDYVKKLDGPNIKKFSTKMDAAKMLQDDIKRIMEEKNIQRAVMIWSASTEIFIIPTDVHSTLAKFEEGLRNNDPTISPSMIYAYAAISMGIPFLNGAPNLTIDTPAMVELAHKKGVVVGGKDYKTGQTLMKTILAPGFKSRMLGISGWFSTNILGNRDGEVLDDPESFKTKEESKLSVLDSILQPDLHPELYEKLYHKVRINYYPPRGDNKESWDNIDIFGWLGYKMQIKINFLCRDSILAAPVVLDLVLFADLAQRAGMKGIQEWLSFYFKSPQTAEGLEPIHDIFNQLMKLRNTLRHLMGEEMITFLGLEYYR